MTAHDTKAKAMKLHGLSPAPGSTKNRKRVGRGPGSGLGKTAGRGTKGQRSRSGYSRRLGFEGGQMPLIRRVPKRGFTNIFRTEYAVINVSQLAAFDGDVTPEILLERGLVRRGRPVKILGDGDLDKALSVTAHRFSRAARQKIEAAGGICEELQPRGEGAAAQAATAAPEEATAGEAAAEAGADESGAAGETAGDEPAAVDEADEEPAP